MKVVKENIVKTDILYKIEETKTSTLQVPVSIDFRINNVSIIEKNNKSYLGMNMWVDMGSRGIIECQYSDKEIIDNNAIPLLVSFFKNDLNIDASGSGLLRVLADKEIEDLSLEALYYSIWLEVTDKELYKKIAREVTVKYKGCYDYYLVYDVSKKNYNIERSFKRNYYPIEYDVSSKNIVFYTIVERDILKEIRTRGIAIPIEYTLEQVEQELKKALAILNEYVNNKAVTWSTIKEVLDSKKDDCLKINICK